MTIIRNYCESLRKPGIFRVKTISITQQKKSGDLLLEQTVCDVHYILPSAVYARLTELTKIGIEWTK